RVEAPGRDPDELLRLGERPRPVARREEELDSPEVTRRRGGRELEGARDVAALEGDQTAERDRVREPRVERERSLDLGEDRIEVVLEEEREPRAEQVELRGLGLARRRGLRHEVGLDPAPVVDEVERELDERRLAARSGR